MVAVATPVQIANDAELFASTFLKILDKEKRLVPFEWNKAQRHFHANRTGRDLILKARQLGFSTYVQAEMYRRTVTKTRTTITLSHDDETTQKLRIMSDRFWENCKFNDIQPKRKYANASMTTYSEFDSVTTIGTAGNVHKGRGDTYTDFHGSEVAFWKDAEKIVAGAMQGGNPDIVLESTPNGAQGFFYELCMEAMRGDGVWTLHFYPWWWDDQYRIPLADGETLTYTGEEQKLVDKHGLTPEQIKWRRLKKKELKDFFTQEYPEDPVTCFLTSGNSYFGDLSDAFTAPLDPVYDPAHEYAAGMDFGQSSDFTALPVLDKTVKQQVDLLHINKLKWKEQRKRAKDTLMKWSHVTCSSGHLTVGAWNEKTEKVYTVGEKCPQCDGKITLVKTPRFAGEKNSIGAVNIEAFVDMGLSVLMFETNNETKSDMMSSLYEGIHTNGWRLQDHPVLRHEMYNFVSKQLPSGVWRLEADGEGHDDTVMGLGIAYWVATVPMQIF